MPPNKYYKKFTDFTKTAKIPDIKSATWLVIVESPSKCAKIESFLGPNYCCIASKGHIRNIAGLKSIQTRKNYAIKFDICPDKIAQVKMLQEITKKFKKDHILIATDDDREGEAIAWHICEVCELNIETTKRIIFHEITKPALLKAVESPININMNLVHAQQARQVLDMLVGFRISPLLWKQIPGGNALSAGRCQTPALRLVYDREMEIQSNKGFAMTYKITGLFTDKELPFELSKEIQTEKETHDFLHESVSFAHQLSIHEKREAYRNAPKPFNTSRLLQSASNQLGMSPSETMSHCQKLYQDGWITYMRTESEKYSNEFIQIAGDYIRDTWNEKYIGNIADLTMNDSKNPHEAIRVTHIEQSVGGEEGRSSKIYHLIWRNTVESCMSSAHMECVPVIITAPMQSQYKYEIETPLFLGWKIVNEKIDLVDVQNKARSMLLYLQSLNKGSIKYKEIHAKVSIKREHTHYTEASLIQMLEKLGIGRPSTFAMLVDTIQERGYVKCQDVVGEIKPVTEYTLIGSMIHPISVEKTVGAEKKKLVLQPTGKNVIEFLLGSFENLFSYSYTENMENELDEIFTSNKEWYEICKKCDEDLNMWIKPANERMKKEYKIYDREDWVIIFSKNGPLLKEKNKTESVEVDDSDSIDSEVGSSENENKEKTKSVFKSIKKDLLLEIDKLQNGEYRWDDLYETPTRFMNTNKETGTGDGNGETDNPNILRVLTPNLSVRKGKFGAYIYYKTPQMTKPKFLNIKKFPLMFSVCEPEVLIQWIKTTYNI